MNRKTFLIVCLLCVMFIGSTKATVVFQDGFENHSLGTFTLPATPDIGYQWNMYTGTLDTTIQNSIVKSGDKALQITKTTAAILQAFPVIATGASNPEAGYEIITKQSWYRTTNSLMIVYWKLGDGSILNGWFSDGTNYRAYNSATSSWYNTGVAVGTNRWDTVELVASFTDAGGGQFTGTSDMWLTAGDGARTLIADDIPMVTRSATTSVVRISMSPYDTTYWDDVSIEKIPEPATVSILGLGLLGLLRRKRY